MTPAHRAAAPVGAAVILAGGQGRRLGGDKPHHRLAGRPLIEHVIERLQPQAGRLLISGPAGNSFGLERYRLPVVADRPDGCSGPLAGLLAAMEWLAAEAPRCRHLLVVPTDVPFLPDDLGARLRTALTGESERVACAASAGTVHPVIALCPLALRDDLARTVRLERQPRVRLWLDRHHPAVVAWPAPPDPFLNINTSADLALAEQRLAAAQSQRL